jgi:hypothetical protein
MHLKRGFLLVNFAAGTCSLGEGVSPYFVFLTLLFIIALMKTPYIKNLDLVRILLQKRVPFLGMSIAAALAVLVHVIICLVVFITIMVAPGEPTRLFVTASGQVAIMNLWMTLLPSSKSPIMFFLTEVPFERSIKYHQLLSLSAMILSSIHMIANASANNDIFFASFRVGSSVTPVYGFIAFLFFSLMTVIAFEPIRKASYELFLIVHFLFPVGLLFIMLHAPQLAYGFIPGIILHGERTRVFYFR